MDEVLQPRPSGLLRRFGAMIYDLLLIIALLFLSTLPFIALRGGESVEPQNFNYQITMVLVVYLFFVGFWTSKGRTLGMQSWGLQLQTPDGRLPSVRAASLRFIASILSLACAGLGFLWQLVDRDKLTWHDRISNTRLMYYPKKNKNKDKK
ncbi:MAG: RDD family protein [Woeseiaceae bacterium]|nr:RDD family protein [Woeseiaceae bacterium]